MKVNIDMENLSNAVKIAITENANNVIKDVIEKKISTYIDENYKFENQCEKCERINMTENENIFYFIPKRITEEGINNLKDVNKTYEFYDEYREIIISKKVAQIIKENVQYAKFYPVILDNRN